MSLKRLGSKTKLLLVNVQPKSNSDSDRLGSESGAVGGLRNGK
jgi:hypothetical protein